MVAIEDEKLLKKSEPCVSGSSFSPRVDDSSTCQGMQSSGDSTNGTSGNVCYHRNAEDSAGDIVMEEVSLCSEKISNEESIETSVTCAITDNPEQSTISSLSSDVDMVNDSRTEKDLSSFAESKDVTNELKSDNACENKTRNLSLGLDTETSNEIAGKEPSLVPSSAIEVLSDNIPKVNNQCGAVDNNKILNTNSSLALGSSDSNIIGEIVAKEPDTLPSSTNGNDSSNFVKLPAVSNQCGSVVAASSLPKSTADSVVSSNTSECDVRVSSPSQNSLVPENAVKKNLGTTSPSIALISLVGYGDSDSDDDMESDNEVQEVLDMSYRGDDPQIIEPPTPSCVVNGETAVKTKDAQEAIPVINIDTETYRYTIDISSGTEDSDSDSESDSSSASSSSTLSDTSSSEESSAEELWTTTTKDPSPKADRPVKTAKKKRRNPLLSAGEKCLDDLPPIEDLKISVTEAQAHIIGYVFNIVERQVVVQGHQGIPPIDLESVLFLENGQKPLGHVFDVFGHIQEPLYVVRFNSSDHVKERDIKIGEPVYFAPETEHTSFVVIDDLMRMRGSDASGLTGNEVLPCELTDYSDDEEEERAIGGSDQTKNTKEFQPSQKRSRGGMHGKDRTNKRGLSNPFSSQGMKSGPRPRHPHTFPKFNPRNQGCRPPRMQGPRFRNYSCRPPFPNQFEMNGNMNGNPFPDCPSPGPRLWSQQAPEQHQFGCHSPFPNQIPGFPPVNDNMQPPFHIPPGPFGSGPPTPSPIGEYQNMPPPLTSGPPPPFHSYPIPGSPCPSPGPPPFHSYTIPASPCPSPGPPPPFHPYPVAGSPCPSPGPPPPFHSYNIPASPCSSPGPPGYQNMGPPMPPPSPQHQSNPQNMAPPHSPYPPNEYSSTMPPPQSPIDISSPPPPLPPAVNGGWIPPGQAPPCPPPQSFVPPGPPPTQSFVPPGPPPTQSFGPTGPPPTQSFGPTGPPPTQSFDPPGPPPAQSFGPPGPPPTQSFGPHGPPPTHSIVPPGPPPAQSFGPPGPPPAQPFGPPGSAPPPQSFISAPPPPPPPHPQQHPPVMNKL